MSVADACVVLFWLLVNGTWLYFILGRYFKLADFFSKFAHQPVWRVEILLTAAGLGAALFPNLVMLFYPVSRGSILLQVIGHIQYKVFDGLC